VILEGLVMTQYPMHNGIKVFGDAGTVAVLEDNFLNKSLIILRYLKSKIYKNSLKNIIIFENYYINFQIKLNYISFKLKLKKIT
jgi:hypothetical protein